MDRRDDGIWFRGQESEEVVPRLALFDLATDFQLVQIPAKNARGQLTI
jgi:hypothetical protein